MNAPTPILPSLHVVTRFSPSSPQRDHCSSSQLQRRNVGVFLAPQFALGHRLRR